MHKFNFLIFGGLIILLFTLLSSCKRDQNDNLDRKPPIIHQILPINSTVGGPLIIKGENLRGSLFRKEGGLTRDQTEVIFHSSYTAQIEILTDSFITLHVPNSLAGISGWVEVSVQVGEDSDQIHYELVKLLPPDQNSLPNYLILSPKDKVFLNSSEFEYFGERFAENIWSTGPIGPTGTLGEIGDYYRWPDTYIYTNRDSIISFNGSEYILYANTWDRGAIFGEYNINNGEFRCSLLRDEEEFLNIAPDIVSGAFYNLTLDTPSGKRKGTFLIVTSEKTGRQFAFD